MFVLAVLELAYCQQVTSKDILYSALQCESKLCYIRCEAISVCKHSHMHKSEALLRTYVGPIIHFSKETETRAPCLLSGGIGNVLTQ